MLAIMAAGAVALAIVLLAIRFVLDWIYKPAGDGFDRAVRAAGSGMLKLTVIVAAVFILASVWAAFGG